jgi:deoxyribodipyrimidine photo-lyase
MLTLLEQQLFEVTIGQDYPLPVVDLFQSARKNEKIYNDASYLKKVV